MFLFILTTLGTKHDLNESDSIDTFDRASVKLVIAHDEGNTLCPIDKLSLPCSKISVLMPEKPEKRLSFMRPTEPRMVTCEIEATL